MKKSKLTKGEMFYLWLLATEMEMEEQNKKVVTKLYRGFGGSKSKRYKDWAKTVK